ncbi:winged helix-turn-helix transcriptional regulator [Streptomyces sp. NPDC093261]|uniref:winged helix-turn-helix transcriptional regulator n=1 Tax=Streptomyces sp. NPDC093261 TaxID=3366037 RepID=UPI003823074F
MRPRLLEGRASRPAGGHRGARPDRVPEPGLGSGAIGTGRDGLIVRTCHPEAPPRVEYEISEPGRGLAPLLPRLPQWAGDRLDQMERSREGYDAAPPR